MEYTPTIGLEIHAELKTRTKMFCNSKNDPDEPVPNTNVCPICLAHPGTLPVINQEAVKHVLKVGLAVGGKLADFSEFDRKNYFYPDLPKGYQISQFKYPLVSGGDLEGVELTRIHLEEDTARSTHDTGNYSLVDFNRAGVPLMELVTEPTVKDAEQAVRFARELQRILRYLGAGDANMEKGEMRVEANVSVSKTKEFGTKVEVKNLNSFKAVERAIAYEIDRQINVIESGEKVVQETRGWDENKQLTFSQRLKEESHDYRYFPDPDLPKLKLSEIPELDHKILLSEIEGKLPSDTRKRFTDEYGLKAEDVEAYIENRELASFFERVAAELSHDKELMTLASNYTTNSLVSLQTGIEHDVTECISYSLFADVIREAKAGTVSSNGAFEIISTVVNRYSAGNPVASTSAKVLAEELNLIQQNDKHELSSLMDEILVANPDVVAQFKAGKESALQFFVGQGMKATKGKANPQTLQKILKEKLS